MKTKQRTVLICFLIMSLLIAGCGQAQPSEPTLMPAPMNTPILTRTSTLTPTPADTPTPTLVPTPYGGGTGSLLVVNGQGSLVKFDVKSGTSSQLIELAGDFTPSPDGKWIAAVNNSETSPKGLYLINVDDGSQSLILGRSDIEDIVWAADSSSVAFRVSHAKDYFFQQDITLYNLDKKTFLTLQTRSYPNPTRGSQISAADYIFAPDNSSIYFDARAGNSKTTNIFEIDVTKPGNNPIHLVSINSYVVTNLKWSPDGKQLAFVNQDEGNIYTLDPISQVVTKLTDLPCDQQAPCIMTFEWSQDGKQIVYGRMAFIYRMNSDGSDIGPLTDGSTWAEMPTISPDGKLIAFVSNGGDIYVMGIDGSNVTKITEGSRVEWQPIQR